MRFVDGGAGLFEFLKEIVLPVVTGLGGMFSGHWFARRKIAADASKAGAEAELTLSGGWRELVERLNARIDVLEARVIHLEEENRSLQFKLLDSTKSA